ncbi:MAG: hypothetical protein EOO77_27985 [Oxalobacteraceae bacterium]|nr:MAG: hypothetical protein EOO77_27985 [Oxalobacteraceae bacterium]
MSYDPQNLREPKKQQKPLWRRLLVYAGIVLGVIAGTGACVYLSDILAQKSVNYRTDASNEIHKVLGEVYAHLGNGEHVTKVEIGSLLFIHNKYIKTETCHGYTSNVFWDKKSHVVHHYSMFTNWFAAGEYEADEIFIIPTYMPEGSYHIVKKTVSICNGREHYTTNYDIVVDFVAPKPKTAH